MEKFDAGTAQVTKGVSGISSKTGSSAENWSANWSMKGCTWVSAWSSPNGMVSSMMIVLSIFLVGALTSTLAFLVRECFLDPNMLRNQAKQICSIAKDFFYVPETFVLSCFNLENLPSAKTKCKLLCN